MMREAEIIKEAVVKAGNRINQLANKHDITQKSNASPVTEADLAANQILKNHLLGYFPEYGWLSEESYDDLIRLKKNRVWIVDPLDGTKEFIHQRPEYVISVALVEHHIPIMAAIYNPVTKELFFAA